MHIGHIPKVYFKNDDLQYAVYSYEEGKVKKAHELTVKDIEMMAQFAAKLHSFTNDTIDQPFLPAVLACFSLQEYIDNMHFRLRQFIAYVSDTHLPCTIVDFITTIPITDRINELIQEEAKGISSEEIYTNSISL